MDVRDSADSGYLSELRRNWEGLATADAVRHVLFPRDGGWTEEEIALHGEREFQTVLNHLASLALEPDPNQPALDFGCGIGRVTQPMARYFACCYGVDISQTMLQRAQERNEDPARVRYVLNAAADLALFPDNFFGFAYSAGVFQHLRPPLVKQYLREMIRTVRPGGILVVQMGEFSPNWAGRKFRVTATVRFRSRLLELLHLRSSKHRYEFHHISARTVDSTVRNAGARLIDGRPTNIHETSYLYGLTYLDDAPIDLVVGKQYTIVKTSSDDVVPS